MLIDLIMICIEMLECLVWHKINCW